MYPFECVWPRYVCIWLDGSTKGFLMRSQSLERKQKHQGNICSVGFRLAEFYFCIVKNVRYVADLYFWGKPSQLERKRRVYYHFWGNLYFSGGTITFGVKVIIFGGKFWFLCYFHPKIASVKLVRNTPKSNDMGLSPPPPLSNEKCP